MAASTYHPDLYFGVAFNREPNDAYMVPDFEDLTNMVMSVDDISRGRQFELGQTMASQPTVLFRDPSEYLNPENTSSPYYPFVQPLREIVMLAQSPNGTSGNLINSGAWHGNKIDAYDPTFEAYANGAAIPNWLAAQGGVTATITTTNPQQGTKSVTYTVASTTAIQGLAWSVPCIPGRQYTTSGYVRQSTASTQQISVLDLTSADVYNRTTASGWGTATTGEVYSTSGGAAGDYFTTPGVAGAAGTGSHTMTSVNVSRNSFLPLSAGAHGGRILVTVPVMPTGAAIEAAMLSRRNGISGDWYGTRISIGTDGVVTVALIKNVGGVVSVIGSTTTLPGVHVAGDSYYIESYSDDGIISGRAWMLNSPVPASSLSTTDTSVPSGSYVGVRTLLATGNTNGTVTISYTNLAVYTAEIVGTSTVTTGAYVRLSVTFTATQPSHTIRLVTSGTAVAGTVNVDALQHEQGAAATTFTSTGPVIYPVMRQYVERWPRIWESQGFEGYTEAVCVDGFAALAAIDLSPEYPGALAASAPDYWWQLNDGEFTGQFLDTSGNAQPPLVRNISKYGAGTDIAVGSSIPIVGDPGATGVGFTATGSAVNWNQVGTSLAAGIGSSLAQINLPPNPAVTWAISAAAWYAATSNGEVQQIFGAFRRASTVNRWWWSPFDLSMDSSRVGLSVHNGGTSSGAGTTTPNYADGLPHFVVATVVQDPTNTTMKFYYDGVLNSSVTIGTATLGGMLGGAASMPMVGGLFDGTNSGRMLSGVVAHASIWNRELTAAEVATLWNAGGLGNAGETPGARSVRNLTRGGYGAPVRISTASATTMQAPSWTGVQDLLTNVQNNTLADVGACWIAPDGALVQETRQDRFLRLAPLYILGENTAGGEIPYLPGIKYDNDPTFVYPDVTASRPGGSTAQGGLVADAAAARRRYFPRSVSLEADVQTDSMIQDLADWTFYTHRAPASRLAEITFDPVSNSSLWAFCLSVENGQRVTVKRRAKAANVGAGITISADFFVETVKHVRIDRTTGEWTVALLLSPIGAAPGVTVQPWILESNTYGVLGSTTVLGL